MLTREVAPRGHRVIEGGGRIAIENRRLREQQPHLGNLEPTVLPLVGEHGLSRRCSRLGHQPDGQQQLAAVLVDRA
jgi:hypothetical protein